MTKFDYSNGIVNKSDRKRLYFFEELSDILIMHDSTNNEINELIYWLYSLCKSSSYQEYKKYKSNYKYDLFPDKQVDENTFMRNVWYGDMIIYSIVSAVHDNNSWSIKDSLSEIIEKIYFILDIIIHPDYRPGLDYEDTRYYVEVEYISKEKQEGILKEHNMDFKKENWRA